MPNSTAKGSQDPDIPGKGKENAKDADKGMQNPGSSNKKGEQNTDAATRGSQNPGEKGHDGGASNTNNDPSNS